MIGFVRFFLLSELLAMAHAQQWMRIRGTYQSASSGRGEAIWCHLENATIQELVIISP
jgi:hypothetical protein